MALVRSGNFQQRAVLVPNTSATDESSMYRVTNHVNCMLLFFELFWRRYDFLCSDIKDVSTSHRLTHIYLDTVPPTDIV